MVWPQYFLESSSYLAIFLSQMANSLKSISTTISFNILPRSTSALTLGPGDLPPTSPLGNAAQHSDWSNWNCRQLSYSAACQVSSVQAKDRRWPTCVIPKKKWSKFNISFWDTVPRWQFSRVVTKKIKFFRIFHEILPESWKFCWHLPGILIVSLENNVFW